MPFKSRAQQKFAFATHQPWAKKWASHTKNFKALPEHVRDAERAIARKRMKKVKK